jgi:hypothetical protein
MLEEPGFHHTDRFATRTNNVRDLFGAKMLAVAYMARVRDFGEMTLDNALIALLEAYL